MLWALDPVKYCMAAPRLSLGTTRRSAWKPPQIRTLDFVSPQDWMCEPWMVAKTGLSVEEHQERTVENFVRLRELAPEVPFTAVRLLRRSPLEHRSSPTKTPSSPLARSGVVTSESSATRRPAGWCTVKRT